MTDLRKFKQENSIT